VVTFDPHPVRVLRPDKAPRLLTSTPHKIRLIRGLGVAHLLIVPFDRAFAATDPARFIEQLAEASRPLREICVGHTWSFGKDRAGNLELLAQLGARLGFAEVGVPVVEIGGEIVSSTLIRAAVERGDLSSAGAMLGRPYSVLGTVRHGDGLGRQLGFPTANLSAHNEQFPPNGVYAVMVSVGGEERLGIANIGIRPTIAHATGERVFEVHIFDFQSDLYGQDIEVTFRDRVRDERKFASVEELKAQIARDAEQVRRMLG
jgi:riboflavin kinase/FMN adenylyltransferase